MNNSLGGSVAVDPKISNPVTENLRVYAAHFVSHVHLMTVPALLPYLPSHYGLESYLELGIGMSILMVATIALQIPVGFLVDGVGPKRMLGIALLLGAFSYATMALIPALPWFYVAMALLGAANTVYHPADYALLSQNSVAGSYGKAFALHTFAGYLGTAVTPFMLLSLTPFIGVTGALYLSAGTALAAYLFLGLDAAFTGQKKLTGSVASSNAPGAKPVFGIKILTNPSVIWLTVFFMFLTFSTVPVQDFGVTVFIEGFSFSSDTAGLLVSVFLFASAFGVLFGGWLADQTEYHSRVAAATFLAAAVLMLIVVFADLAFIALAVVLFLMGFAMGSIAPSRDMMVKSVAAPGTEGRIFGIVSTGFSIGGAIAPLIFTYLLDHDLPIGVFVFAAILMTTVSLIAIWQEIRAEKASKPETIV